MNDDNRQKYYRHLGTEAVDDLIMEHQFSGATKDNLTAILAGMVVEVAQQYKKLLSPEAVAMLFYQIADKYATDPSVKKKWP